jgi:F0F1-type ATP synthase membrane subunit b/b'
VVRAMHARKWALDESAEITEAAVLACLKQEDRALAEVGAMAADEAYRMTWGGIQEPWM